MSQKAYIRASLATMVLDTFPSTIRKALISNEEFRTDYGLTADSVVTFGDGGPSFQRSELLVAVRRAFRARKKVPVVVDKSGEIWNITFDSRSNPQCIALSHGGRRITNAWLALLSPSKKVRNSVFRHEASRTGLPSADRGQWKALLTVRAPNDDELSAIYDDINITPLAIRGTISESIANGCVSLPQVIPQSVIYFERLIGRLIDGQDFDGYLQSGLREHLHELVTQNAFWAYRQGLLLAAQPTINHLVSEIAPPLERIATVWNELVSSGDVMSRAAAIETGLEIAHSNVALRQPLGTLIENFIRGAPTANVNPYELLSSLIMLVYGEIAYSRVLASKPPYWRRLAAIAHAAMMAQCVVERSGDATHFLRWASTARAQASFLQCLADLRVEPRWIVEFIHPDQLKNELGGRVFFAAQANEALVEVCGWKPLLLDEGPIGLRRQLNLAQIFLPGPLEGGLKPTAELPAEAISAVRADLIQRTPTAKSFSALANAALLFRVTDDVIDLAAEALSRTNYYVERHDDQSLAPLLLSLATVSAATRNHKLADALFTLLRNYRRFYQIELDVSATFEIGMVACASRLPLEDWSACVGNFMTDLAFQQLTREETIQLHSQVQLLCHLVPELWATCGQAEAALQSLACR